jgi:uncharacterized protein (TIGR02145 family)
MKKTILLFTGLAFLTFKNQAQTVSDIDGNVYNTVTIGAQVWMKENLKVTHYRNGESIPNVTDGTAWKNLFNGALCYYNNDSAANASDYGVLYNWYAVNDSMNICPFSWHVPTDAEWTTLTGYLGGQSIAGGKLKETGTTHWQSPNTGATNETGFTALPGGFRDNIGFNFYRYDGLWWSFTERDSIRAFYNIIFFDFSNLMGGYSSKTCGYSVRCIRDSTTVIKEFNNKEEIKIYPNPAIDRVYIDCAERQVVKMQIYNVVGECVLQGQLSNGTNDIDVSSLSKGIYVIKLTGTDLTVQRKLTKE